MTHSRMSPDAEPPFFEAAIRQLRASSEVLINAYKELHETGEMTEPQLAAAALRDVDAMVNRLGIAGLDRVGFDGSHVKELIRRGRTEGEGET